MRISDHIEARWQTEQKEGKRTRKLEIIDFSTVPTTLIVLAERGARMLAALIHVEFDERKTGGEKK